MIGIKILVANKREGFEESFVRFFMPDHKKVAVIGAGISGLVFANRLREVSEKHGLALEVRVFDAAPRAGGTLRTETKDGFLLEKGPDSFLSERPWGVELCHRLGLENELIGTETAFRRTFVARGGRLYGLPDGFYLIAPREAAPFLMTPLFSPFGKLRMLSECWLPPTRSASDESVASFIRRRFGAEALERVGQPMIAGVYSGDPEKLGILSTMPHFRELEAEYGSVIRGLRAQAKKNDRVPDQTRGPRYSLFVSLKNGMQALTDELARRLGETSLCLKFKAVSLSFEPGNARWTIVSESGERIQADVLCLAVPACTASRWLEDTAPELARRLDDLAYESVATLNLAFDSAQITHPLDGFGFVVPRSECRSLMACTFVHRKFAGRAPEGKVLLRAFVGGAFGREIFGMPDAELKRAVQKDLAQLLGIRGEPLFSTLERYPRALPQYGVGHQEWVRTVEEEADRYPGLILTGASYHGTGIPDCVHDAERKAEAAAARLFGLNFSEEKSSLMV